MTPDEVFENFRAGFPRRKYSTGLLVALIDFMLALDAPSKGFLSFAEFLEAFPRQMKTRGETANTLIVRKPDGKTLSIRPFYNEAERYFRAEQKRFDYPSSQAHATQAWEQYPNWLNALATFTEEELALLKGRVNQFVLDALPSQEYNPATVQIEPPMFRFLLERFDMAAKKGELTGAAFQGIVFGFLRADNPHLQIEIDKVRVGSKRLQRIGDVDGWEGPRLAITAEVKQYALSADDIRDLAPFANDALKRGDVGVVAALGFKEGARKTVEDLGLVPLDVDDMVRIVELWDPLKQRTAVSSLLYYATHVEKNASLMKRIDAFLENERIDWQRVTIDAEESDA